MSLLDYKVRVLNGEKATGSIVRVLIISGDGTDEEYYSEWDRGANSINTFYEYLKHLSADSSDRG